MDKLEIVISSLYQQKGSLNNKILISADYDFLYKKKMKTISDEVIKLQKVFLDVISN